MPNTPARPELPAPDGVTALRIAGRFVEIEVFRPSTVYDYGKEIEAWARADERRKALEQFRALAIEARSLDQTIAWIIAQLDCKEPT